jgi:pSer/pThr/pTyr-binding forkhead associated (FHA) protein
MLVSGGYFVDGRDTVQVLGRQNVNSDQTVELLPPTSTATELTTWAANFNFERGSGATKGLLGIEDAIQRMSQLVPVAGSRTAAIIYLGRYIEDPSPQVAVTAAQNTASAARRDFISIYALQTDPNRGRADALQVLATSSGGQYAALDRTSFSSAVSSVYNTIAAQRAYYTVSYRSNLGASGEREITINSTERPSAGVTGTYTINLQPASLTISEPVAGSTIRREAQLGEDNTLSADTSTVKVVANVAWPDGFPRSIVSAELFANDNLEGTLDVGPDDTQLEFEWDLSDIVDEGLNPVKLEVKATDEIGLAASVETGVSVQVIIPATPTATGPGAATVAVGGVLLFCVLGAVALAIVGGVYFFVIRRPAPAASEAPAAAPEPRSTIMGADAFPGLTLATLTLQEGPQGLVGETFRLYMATTVIGRNPTATDITFYPDEESSVSRMHCTIQMAEDNTFRLTDNASSAGTRLNGRRIQPSDPVVLADGDEIVLGDLARRGVKLKFSLPSKDSATPYSGSADDRTHIIGDQGYWEPPSDH